jgi:hypothetical protein
MGFHYVSYASLPECCRTCKHQEWDAQSEYHSNFYFCTKGQFIPTKQKTCKRKDKQESGIING